MNDVPGPPSTRGGDEEAAVDSSTHIDRPALVVVDVQQAIDDPSWGTRNNAALALANMHDEYATVTSCRELIDILEP